MVEGCCHVICDYRVHMVREVARVARIHRVERVVVIVDLRRKVVIVVESRRHTRTGCIFQYSHLPKVVGFQRSRLSDSILDYI